MHKVTIKLMMIIYWINQQTTLKKKKTHFQLLTLKKKTNYQLLLMFIMLGARSKCNRGHILILLT